MYWLLAQSDQPTTNVIGNSLVNWIVCILIGLLVWLVKRLVDNNQKILDSLKEEGAEERKLHREDIKAIVSEGDKYRQSSEKSFDKVADAINKLASKLDNLSLGMDTDE